MDRGYPREQFRGGPPRGRGGPPRGRGGPPRGRGGFRKSGPDEERIYSKVQVFVEGLPKATKIPEVVKFFSVVGQIKIDRLTKSPRVWLYHDKVTNQPTGECTITYTNEDTQQKALQAFNGQLYAEGFKVKVTPSIVKPHMAAPPPRQPGPPAQGGRGSRGGGGPIRSRGRGNRHEPYPSNRTPLQKRGGYQGSRRGGGSFVASSYSSNTSYRDSSYNSSSPYGSQTDRQGSYGNRGGYQGSYGNYSGYDAQNRGGFGRQQSYDEQNYNYGHPY